MVETGSSADSRSMSLMMEARRISVMPNFRWTPNMIWSSLARRWGMRVFFRVMTTLL